MSLKRCVIDGKTYELTPDKAEKLQRLFDESIRQMQETRAKLPPLPPNCLSAKHEEPVREVWRKYRKEARKLITGESGQMAAMLSAADPSTPSETYSKIHGEDTVSTEEEHTPVNEALDNAGEGIGRYNKKQSEKLIAKLLQAKTPDIAPFRQSVMEIDALYNRPSRIAIDAENVYILPVEQREE